MADSDTPRIFVTHNTLLPLFLFTPFPKPPSLTFTHQKQLSFSPSQFHPEMQEIHSLGGTRFFGGGGGGGGGDRRLRPHHHNHHQPLKCPRCDSLNTAAAATSNNNNNNNNASSSAPATASSTPPPEANSNSHSSSESSTLTVAATEAMSAPTSNVASNSGFLLDNVRDSKMFGNANNLSLESGSIFSEIGSFTSLMASNNEALGFGFGNSNNNNNNNDTSNSNILDATSLRFGVSQPDGSDQVHVAPGGEHGQWQAQSHQEFGTASFLDHAVPQLEFSSMQHKSGFGSLDWQPGADQGLFDLPNTVDQPYWAHHTHWSDQDNPSLFHLP
ncbi:dof zinc finger protein DOF5.4 [Cajanus cajan]|uniref:dof zinc finger protein DOF5.4 n=1 Tax=Cajanus cajan TaxID=3821 RepID=UPI00098D8F58|nr:dof zinc finger protein DOF5.4 [Cajanus cajan]